MNARPDHGSFGAKSAAARACTPSPPPEFYGANGCVYSHDGGIVYAPQELRLALLRSAAQHRIRRLAWRTFPEHGFDRRWVASRLESARQLRKAIKDAMQ